MDKKALEQKKQQIVRMIQSESDFQLALSAIRFLLEEVDYKQQTTRIVNLRKLRCYETTAIVSFTRPLTETRRGNTLSTKFIGLKLSEPDRKKIIRFKDIRHSYLAHSSEDAMHFKVSRLVLQNSINVPYTHHYEGLVLTEEDAFDVERLSKLFLNHVQKTKLQLFKDSPELVEMYKQPTAPFPLVLGL